MRVFITGASGYIGGAVARALADRGHEICALAHHDEAQRSLDALGYETVPGDLADPAGLVEAARDADAVVHAANTNGDDAARVDDAATRAIVDALEGTGKRFVYTSGIWVVGPTTEGEAAEGDPVDPLPIVAWRGPLEEWLQAAAERGVHTIVIRPGVVYGRGGGLPAMMMGGDLPVVGDGRNRWPLIHVDDLGRLYAAALERAPAGSILHAVADEATAGEIGRHLGADHVPLEQARETMGGLADALALDQRLSTRRTRHMLDWAPQEPPLLETRPADLGRGERSG